jgi:hypothetical protein
MRGAGGIGGRKQKEDKCNNDLKDPKNVKSYNF